MIRPRPPVRDTPLLLHVFPSFAVGGSQSRFVSIANHSGARYRHAIVALDGDYACMARLQPEVDAQHFDLRLPKRATVANVVRLRKILAEQSPDLLVTYNWGAIEWALANWPRVVPHLHIEDGFGPEEAGGQLLRRVLARRLALANSTVVLPSRTLYRLALEKWRLPAGRVCHVPNGIDIARFAGCRDPVALPHGEGAVIGTVAALRPEKNVARLLRAFQRARNTAPCRLVIAGDGPLRGELETLATQLLPPDSFVFLGHVAAAERVYAALDIFALTSDTEQMPLSLMEAMAAGLPVVATEVGDVREMVAPGNIPYIVPRDEHALSEALARLAADPDARRTLAGANRAWAKKYFGMDEMFSRYDSLFGGLVVSPTSARRRRV